MLKEEGILQNLCIKNSRECGASEALLSIARRLQIDQFIFTEKVQWREDALALIVGGLIYPGTSQFLINLYRDTVLWQLCGHPCSLKPDIHTNVDRPLNKLFERKSVIERALSARHLKTREMVLHLCKLSYPIEKTQDNALYFAFFTDFQGYPIAIRELPYSNELENLFKGHKHHVLMYVVDRNLLSQDDFSSFISQKHVKQMHNRNQVLLNFFSLRMELGLFSSANIASQLLVCKLSYYIQKYIEELFEKNAHVRLHVEDISEAIEKLKSIRSQVLEMADTHTEKKSLLSVEHKHILKALELPADIFENPL